MGDNGRQFYEFEDFRLDARRRVLFRGDSVVNLTPKAVDILRLLLERSGELVTKEEIFSKAWPDTFVEEANLSHHIFKLRKALGESDARELIETVPKRGYRFVGKLREASDRADAEPMGWSRISRWALPAAIIGLIVIVGIGWFSTRNASFSATQTTPPATASLAVLPFVNESGDEEIEYLADGLTESLITRLSGRSSLRVRPYSTVSRFKGSGETAPDAVGKELQVGSVLIGRVTKRGEYVRLSLSLIDVPTGYQTWGKQYDRDVGSLALLQADIIKDVLEYLPGKLSAEEDRRLVSSPTQNSDAYVLYLKGRYQLNRKSVEGINRSIEYFSEAAAIDPSYALAYSGLADAYNQMGLWVVTPPGEIFPKAKAAAERALSLDSGLAEPRTALACARFYYDWDFAAAESDFRQAIGDKPDYSFARESYGVMIYETNPARVAEALRELDAASEVDPLALAPYFWRASIFYFEGKNDMALRELREVETIDPNFKLGHALKGAIHREMGDLDGYLEHWLKASPLEGVDLSDAEIDRLRRTYASKGIKAYEVAYAELLMSKSKERYVSPVFVAMHYSLAGESDRAIEWLEKAVVERSSWLVELKVDPAWKNLRNDPRYMAILRRIGFPG